METVKMDVKIPFGHGLQSGRVVHVFGITTGSGLGIRLYLGTN